MTDTTATGGRHWTLEQDAGHVAWLVFDKQGATANSLGRAAMEELDARLAELALLAPRGLVIASAKSGFIAGADVSEFAQVASPEEAVPFIRAAHAVLDRLERLPFPTVAAINGYCLGGGLELAMACRHRVCIDDPKTVLGLPEVMLGIHPGFGGTVRAVRLVGVTAARSAQVARQWTGATSPTRIKSGKQARSSRLMFISRAVSRARFNIWQESALRSWWLRLTKTQMRRSSKLRGMAWSATCSKSSPR